jgi:hypothetical protein
VPELRFEVDATLEYASRIDELLREVAPPPAADDEAEAAHADEPEGEDGED